MLKGSVVVPLLALAAPMVAVLVAQTIVGVAETFYIGLLGTDALAGAALVFPISMLMTMMSNGGIGGGVSSAVSRAVGAGRQSEADALVLHAIVVAVVFGIAFTVGVIVFGPRLYGALGGRSGVLEVAVTYSTYVFAAAIPTWIANLMAAALRGVGNVRVPALVTLLGCVILVPMSPLLIFGFGPIPRLGVAGAGLAIMIYYIGASLYLGFYLVSGRGGLTLRIARLRWTLFASILKVGLISAVGTLVANLTVVVVTGLVGRFGANAIAGYGAASRLDYVQIPFLFGLGTAVVTMVGVNFGAGQHARARRIAWIGATIAAVTAEAIGLLAAAFPHVWIGIFSRDPAVLASGATYLHRVAPAYGAVGLGMLLYFAAQGTGRMLVPFLAGVARLGVAAGAGWFAIAHLGADMPTLFLIVAAGALVFGAVNAGGMAFSRRRDVNDSQTKPPSRRWRAYMPRIAIGAAATLATALVGAVALADRKVEAPIVSRPPVVSTVLAVPAANAGLRFTGVVHARYESALGFRVAGKIAERMVDPGDRVRKGQSLLRLDETDFSLALKAAHAAVEAARATSLQAASDEARRRTLVAKGWVTMQAYEQNKALSDSTAAQLASALAQEKQVADQATYAVLQADADGVIMDVPSDPGQVVAAGQTVVRLAHDGSREAEIYLPEGEERKAGDAAVAALYARPNDDLPATLRELSAMADPATRTYRARYVLGAAGRDAPLGATVTLKIFEPSSGNAAFDVPVGAIFDAGNGPSVWVVDPLTSIVTPRAIRVSQIGEERATITGSLGGGERIVALGTHLLKSGDTVQVSAAPLDTAAR